MTVQRNTQLDKKLNPIRKLSQCLMSANQTYTEKPIDTPQNEIKFFLILFQKQKAAQQNQTNSNKSNIYGQITFIDRYILLIQCVLLVKCKMTLQNRKNRRREKCQNFKQIR